MRVAELTALRRFELRESEPERPQAGQVMVRVRAVGICGSDLHYFSEGGIGDVVCRYPMVLGHEPVGEIVQSGAGVSGWQAGDRVLLEPALYCYDCEFCLRGRHNVCPYMHFMSTPGTPGFFRELCVLPARNVLPVPPGVGLEEATLFEPLAVALHSLRLAEPALGEWAAVWGAGPIGLLTISVLRLSGVSRIWSVEPVKHRRAYALQAGADVAIDPAEQDAARQILKDTGDRGVDMVFDCAAKGNSLNESLRACRPAGRVIVTGIHTGVHIPLEVNEIRRKELQLVWVRRSNHETDEAVELLRTHPARFGALVTHRRPLEEIQQAFELAEGYHDGAGKVVITL